MKDLQMAVKRFWADEEGVTAIEYGLIAALIAVFLIVSLQTLGTSLAGIFTYIAGKLDAAKA